MGVEGVWQVGRPSPAMSWDFCLNSGVSAWHAGSMSQSQISRTLRDEASVARVASILSRERFDSRSALGRRICEEFSFTDARGRPQLAGCMKALGALAERVPDIVLPPPKASAPERRPRLLKTDVPEPEGVPAHPTRIRDLGIVAVADAADRALWNTLMAREHPDFGAVSPKSLGGASVALHIQVDDADDVSRRFVAAGGTVLRELSEEPDGERRGTFLDPFGYRWMVGELVEEVSKDELRDRVGDFDVT